MSVEGVEYNCGGEIKNKTLVHTQNGAVVSCSISLGSEILNDEWGQHPCRPCCWV